MRVRRACASTRTRRKVRMRVAASAPRAVASAPPSPSVACTVDPDIGNILPNLGLPGKEPSPVICLLPNCCFLSETSRMLEIYRALVAKGAAVRVATHGGTHEGVLCDADV